MHDASGRLNGALGQVITSIDKQVFRKRDSDTACSTLQAVSLSRFPHTCICKKIQVDDSTNVNKE